jgi:hypothetical protein
VVVEAFFKYNELVAHNENVSLPDSIQKFMEENRQRYYDIMDSHGYYHSIPKRKIDSLGIDTHELNRAGNSLVFRVNAARVFIVDLNEYKEKSGVFLFNGTDAPVYWESTREDGLFHDSLVHFFTGAVRK